MAHVRVQFRNAIEGLLNGITDFCPVFINRADPLQENQDAPELPCCLVLVSGGDPVDDEVMGPVRLVNHHLNAQIDIVVKIGATFDDDLEAFALAAEKAMAADNAFPGFKDVTEKAYSKGRPNGEGRSDLMMLRLTYEGWAMTTNQDPETLI